tara:strand:- start:862 stop:1011 length:150 start_codon:yes stop_codon:yes gene_type:complete
MYEFCNKCDVTYKAILMNKGIFVGDNWYCTKCAEELEGLAILSQQEVDE